MESNMKTNLSTLKNLALMKNISFWLMIIYYRFFLASHWINPCYLIHPTYFQRYICNKEMKFGQANFFAIILKDIKLLYVCMCDYSLLLWSYKTWRKYLHGVPVFPTKSSLGDQVWDGIFPGLCLKIAVPWYLLLISSGEIFDMNIIWWERNSVKLALEVVTSYLAPACHWILILDTERDVYVLCKLTSL